MKRNQFFFQKIGYNLGENVNALIFQRISVLNSFLSLIAIDETCMKGLFVFYKHLQIVTCDTW